MSLPEMSLADGSNILSFPEGPVPLRRSVGAPQHDTPLVRRPTRLGTLHRWAVCTVWHRRSHRTFTRYFGSYGRCSSCWRAWD